MKKDIQTKIKMKHYHVTVIKNRYGNKPNLLDSFISAPSAIDAVYYFHNLYILGPIPKYTELQQNNDKINYVLKDEVAHKANYIYSVLELDSFESTNKIRIILDEETS